MISMEPHTTLDGKHVAESPSLRARAPMPPLMKRIAV